MALVCAATPAYGASMDGPPGSVSLTFTTDLAQAHITVSGAVVATATVIQARTVTQPVAIIAPGHYVVAYHVITMDGGEVTGTLPFTVTPAADAPAASPAPPASPAEAAAGHHHGDHLDALTAVMLGLNVLVVLVLGFLFLLTGRRRTLADRHSPCPTAGWVNGPSHR